MPQNLFGMHEGGERPRKKSENGKSCEREREPMSDYHTQTAFDARLAARRANPITPLPLAVFYHIACMNNWREVVGEQLCLLGFAGLVEANCCVLGTEGEANWCEDKAAELGVKLKVAAVRNKLSLYEGPTLAALHSWALKNPLGSVLYFHTKGVSKPHDRHKIAWRRLMQRHVIADWRANLEKLAVADILGVSWQELRDFPHFCGNFWMARCDWLSHLDPPARYRRSRTPFVWAGQSWTRRMYAETWLGSKNYHHVESLVCRNGCLWEGPQVFSYDASIPGFAYEGDCL